MPSSVGIAAFVVGLGLLIAAIVGQKVKLISIELPDLSRAQRLTVGALGLALTAFGLSEARGDADRSSTAAVAGGVAPPAPSPTVRLTTSTPVDGTQPVALSDDTMACITAVAPEDVFKLDLEPGRRTDRKPQAGMPRDAEVVLLPRVDGRPLGAIVYRTRASGGSFRIAAVYDAACAPVATYRNASNPDVDRDAVGNYETMQFTFGPTTVAITLAYGEGEPLLVMTGRVV